MNINLFPSNLRACQRQRLYLNRLQATRRNYPITLSGKVCTLIRQLRGCAPQDREFIRRAFAGLYRSRSHFNSPNQSAGECHE